jgi:hypothetical protein
VAGNWEWPGLRPVGCRPSDAAGPGIALSQELSPNEQKRDKLQQAVSAGWSKLLHHSILSFTRLPAGIALTPTICQLSTKTCIDFCTADGLWKKSTGCDSRVGPHAIDRSYGQYFFGGKPNDNRSFVDANVSVSFAAGPNDGSLKVLIEPVATADYGASDFVVRINSRFLWNRSGTVDTDPASGSNPSIRFTPAGLPASRVTVFAPLVDSRRAALHSGRRERCVCSASCSRRLHRPLGGRRRHSKYSNVGNCRGESFSHRKPARSVRRQAAC